MSRNLSNCNPDAFAPADQPAGWQQNDTFLCGISWPSPDPYTNLSNCCTGEVHVSNGCLQWCATDRSMNSFLECAVDSIADFPASKGLATCNGNFAGRTTISGGLAGSALMLVVLAHFLV